jgi:lysophospholipase L1-like esterase
VIVFETYALLTANTPDTEQKEQASYLVTNDTVDPSRNGSYSWVTGTTYRKDADTIENTVDSSNTGKGVSGKAVSDYVDVFAPTADEAHNGYAYAVTDLVGKILLSFDINGNTSIGDLGDLRVAINAISDAGIAVVDAKLDSVFSLSSGSTRGGYATALTDSLGKIILGVLLDGSLKLSKGSEFKETASSRGGYAYVLTDNVGKVLLSVTNSGVFGTSTIPDIKAYIDAAIAAVSNSAKVYEDSITEQEYAVASGLDIVCWGDSMTAGAGASSSAFRYPERLGVLTGLTSRNAGVGGETSTTITSRSGAIPFFISIHSSVSAKEIPASGAVQIEFGDYLGNANNPLLQGTGGASGFAGVLNGIQGTIGNSGGNFFFTRSVSGSVVPMNRAPYPYRTDYSEARREDVQIIWIGQNGNGSAAILRQVQEIINHSRALYKKFIVIPKPTSDDSIDDTFKELYGRNVVTVRQYMCEPIYAADGTTIVSSYGLSDAGITPTSNDLLNVQAGTVPSSLRSDSVHFNDAGYEIVAQLVYKRLIELKYI